jgi:hypothetical protein
VMRFEAEPPALAVGERELDGVGHAGKKQTAEGAQAGDDGSKASGVDRKQGEGTGEATDGCPRRGRVSGGVNEVDVMWHLAKG